MERYFFYYFYSFILGFPGDASVKNPPANAVEARDMGLIPGSERCPGEGYGNPLQCSCLENLMDRGAWQAVVHGVAKSWTRLKRLSTFIFGCTGSSLLLTGFL